KRTCTCSIAMAPVKSPKMDLESVVRMDLACGLTHTPGRPSVPPGIRRAAMRLFVILVSALVTAPGFAGTPPAEPKASKAVLVTGASSGIGRKITERLAADGYFVYATARKEADLEALGAIKNVHP